MKIFALFLMGAAFALPAADPAGFHLWKAAELKTVPAGSLADLGNYNFAAVNRKANGAAEVHETMSDIFVVTAGEATLTVGGTVVDAKTTQPNEIRGTSIKGGVEKKIGPGDILTIPAKMPHQITLEPGKELSYVAIKVKQ
jgi:mannose-6-phosphate isomerase-like protein (cupin superfamily)